MGAEPHAALAIAAVPYGLEAQVEEDLFQMMAGATSIMREVNCALAGGHSCEAAELSLGREMLVIMNRIKLFQQRCPQTI